MRDFEDSTLWRISEFERVRSRSGGSAFARLGGASVLPTTLLADLRRLDASGASDEPLEVVAACIRHREAALLCLQYDGLVWPVTLFPQQMLYHSPRDLTQALPTALAHITLISAEPPGVRPPGHWMHERIAQVEHYRPLLPLLWSLALDGPRATLLAEIAGTAAYRALKNPEADGATLRGPLRSAAQRLRRETVALRDIAAWPGMGVDRASRLLNGFYLSSSLLATRSHPAARAEPRGLWRGAKLWR
ncbi:MAG TPA: hypothetical protein VFA35_07385 [Burkholderiaceae bacterium]|nr:hypothetical protein [Burkholderiaceae bacterium]